MKKLNRPYHTRILGMIFGLMLISMFAAAQGWEVIEEDNFEVPSEIISPSRGGYMSIGTTILPGAGPVLLLDRVDIEGNRIFLKQYDVITPASSSAKGYTVNEFSLNDQFLITGPQIGYLKVLNNGVIDWQKDITDLNLPEGDLVVWSSITNNNQAYIVAEGSNNSITNTSLVKITSDGDPVWEFPATFNKPYNIKPISSITTNDDGCAIICDYTDGAETGVAIIRTDSIGVELWTQKYPSLSANGRTLVQDLTGDILFVDRSSGNNIIYRVKDNTGSGLAWKSISQDDLFNAAKLLVDLDGNFVLSGHRIENDLSKPTLLKFDENGIEIWTRLHEVLEGATIISTSIDKANNVVSNGQYFLDQQILYATPYRLSVDFNGDVYDNFITGNVYSDNNNSCSFDNNDFPLSNWLIEADGDVDFYGITDEQGNYSIPVPIGAYTVTVSSPSAYYETCIPSYTVESTDTPTSFVLDFGMQPDVMCPYLQVEISVPFLRFCYEQVYYVDYCNYGTEAATDVSVEVVLDSLLQFVSASPVAPIVQADDKYLFNIPGTLGVGECGQFMITTQLTCEEDFVGSTACVEATISPLCNEQVDAAPFLLVEGFCDEDSIQFNITNVGNATLLSDRNFIIIEDHIILSVGVITDNLEPGEMVSRRIMANEGVTANFLIEQEIPIVTNQIIDPYTTATVEGCVGFPSAPYTYSNYLDDDGELWYSEECNEIVSSFDPNDKQVIPNGIDEEHHYILPNTSMEYKVRFQNTGTDTAFLVVIRDTISQYLDLTTFVPGASSHPYRYEILNDGYLKFTFENIVLPDSTTNEPASHGFIKYTIRQQPDVALGSVIENCAAIYFDFNSPVLTNCTWNTVQLFDNWVVSTDDSAIDETSLVKIYPNPFNEYVNFEIQSDQSELLYAEKTFILYSSNGKLIRTETFDESTFQFQRNDLPKGMYFYKIHHNGNSFNSGKLIMQ